MYSMYSRGRKTDLFDLLAYVGSFLTSIPVNKQIFISKIFFNIDLIHIINDEEGIRAKLTGLIQEHIK